MSDDFNMDEVRQSSGLIAMATIDAIDEEFLVTMTSVHPHIMTCYQHLIDHDMEHIHAVSMIHGIIGNMLEQARQGEGPQ